VELVRAFFAAVESGDADGVRAALERGVAVNAVDPRWAPLDGETALMLAAGRGDVGTLRLLLARGADVDLQPATGWTALMRACNAGRLDCARLLLRAGADPNLRNIEGYTAYGRTRRRDAELLRLLLASGAEPAEPSGG
jgi:ankyrin repeat protein